MCDRFLVSLISHHHMKLTGYHHPSMVDTVDRQTRSRIMASVRGRDTRPEMFVRRGLHRLGFRFRVDSRDMPGSPDLKLTRHRAVIFVHGCFWHRHDGCRYASMPRSNVDFWVEKFTRNVERDRENERQLLKMGWRVIVVWECTLRRRNVDRARPIEQLADWVRGDIKTGII